MNYSSDTWLESLKKLTAFAPLPRGTTSAVLGYWAQELATDPAICKLTESQISRALRAVKDAGEALTGFSDLRHKLLSESPEPVVTVRKTLAFAPWQQALVERHGELNSPNFLESTLRQEGFELALSTPSSLTWSNLSRLCDVPFTIAKRDASVAGKTILLRFDPRTEEEQGHQRWVASFGPVMWHWKPHYDAWLAGKSAFHEPPAHLASSPFASAVSLLAGGNPIPKRQARSWIEPVLEEEFA